MTAERAETIAATLVRQFGQERFFALSLGKVEDLESIAVVLREQYCCTVVYNFARNKISVYYPKGETDPYSLAELNKTRKESDTISV